MFYLYYTISLSIEINRIKTWICLICYPKIIKIYTYPLESWTLSYVWVHLHFSLELSVQTHASHTLWFHNQGQHLSLLPETWKLMIWFQITFEAVTILYEIINIENKGARCCTNLHVPYNYTMIELIVSSIVPFPLCSEIWGLWCPSTVMLNGLIVS